LRTLRSHGTSKTKRHNQHRHRRISDALRFKRQVNGAGNVKDFFSISLFDRSVTIYLPCYVKPKGGNCNMIKEDGNGRT
jgi:hypothetical protein